MATLMKSTPLAHMADVACRGTLRARAARGPIVRAFAALRHAWRAYVGYKRLAVLSDDALAAKGLKRGDIGRHVFFGKAD